MIVHQTSDTAGLYELNTSSEKWRLCKALRLGPPSGVVTIFVTIIYRPLDVENLHAEIPSTPGDGDVLESQDDLPF